MTGSSFRFNVASDQLGVIRRSALTGLGYEGGVRTVRGMSGAFKTPELDA